MNSLQDMVNVHRRFLRSVNIVRDQNRGAGMDGYVITPLVLQTLYQIADSFVNECTDRAFTLTGPYGTGKSSFGLLLFHLLSNSEDRCWDLLYSCDRNFAKKLHDMVFGSRVKQKGFLMLPVTARRASVTTLLSEAFDGIDSTMKDAVRHQIDGLRKCSDTSTTIRLIEEIAELACQQNYCGLFFIVDEFGKIFEEAYFNKRNTDINLLQELAEAASRSSHRPILFLGMLHQGFGNYVEDIQDIRTKNEFNKIQGRFTPLSFIETPAAQFQLLATAIECSKSMTEVSREQFEALISQAESLSLPNIAGMTVHDYRRCARQTWPIHPLASLALPMLFRRFGQNERSLFTFLASNEPHGFQDFLSSNQPGDLLGLDWIFDYLIINYETQLSRQSQGKIFLEANDILSSKELSLNEQRVIKVVAILSSLGKQSGLKPSLQFIQYAMYPCEVVLKKLLAQSILVYRKFSDAYCLWEGSDVDLQACAERADRALGKIGFALAQPLMISQPPHPIIAKRHSFNTGTLRYFQVDYVDTPDDIKMLLTRQKNLGGASGRILICFSSSPATMDTFIEMGKHYTKECQDLLFAVPQDIDELRAALYEVQRLKWIQDNTEELRDDRVAQRELDLRQVEANQKVAQLKISLMDPRPVPRGCSCQWIWRGVVRQLKNGKDVSVLLSTVCDQLYPDTPRILNEMINKRIISAQAAAARNNLVKYLNSPESVAQPLLGITGFPPDRSIYEGVLQASDIHRRVGHGKWGLYAPPENNEINLWPAWHLIEQEVFSTIDPLPLKSLYAKLREPPYGMQDGVMPIILMAFFAANRREVTLYQEGTFLYDPQESSLELMVRRPDLFSIAGARLYGTRLKIVRRLAQGLNTDDSVGEVVKHIYQMLGSLSKYAKNTKRVTKMTADFRQVMSNAQSPEKLLFVDLPLVFGMQAINEDDEEVNVFNLYFESLNHCLGELASLLPALLQEQRAILLSKCKLPNSQEGWTTLYERACFLAPKTTDSDLIPFLQNVANTMGDWNKADAVIGYMVSTPLANWGELDIRNFPGVAEGKAQLFMQAYRPYAKSTAMLSHEEQTMVKSIKKELMKRINSEVKAEVYRAAFLECIEEIDGGKNK